MYYLTHNGKQIGRYIYYVDAFINACELKSYAVITGPDNFRYVYNPKLSN